MGRAELHAFRRKLASVEESLFVTRQPLTAGEIREALHTAPESAAERVAELVAVAAGSRAPASYLEAHGACGVLSFTTSGGRTIWRLPIETFPDHVNNVYLVLEEGAAGGMLVDAGSQLASSRDDLARAAAVLARVHGLGDALDTVADVVITHGHIDHYGGAGGWQARGARIHAHELDARVLTRFDERLVTAALGLRQFLAAAGVGAAERAELESMYLFGKSRFKPVPVDGVLVDGSRVRGAIAHHAPGHCPGQICLQVDDVLLTADHVLPRITPHQSPESITASCGLDHYFEALARVRRVADIRLALPGHEEPIRDMPGRVDEIVAFHRARLHKVLGICVDEPRTVREITQAMFGEQSGYGRILAYEEAGAHVEYLARRGQLEIVNLGDFEDHASPVLQYRAA